MNKEFYTAMLIGSLITTWLFLVLPVILYRVSKATTMGRLEGRKSFRIFNRKVDR